MSERQLNPYDTGQRAEPEIWQFSRRDPKAFDSFGKVDFTGDDGETVATIWLEWNEQGERYVLNVVKHGNPLGLHVHKES